MANTNALGSGIDVNGIVSALMDVEKIPLSRMGKSKAACETQLNNYVSLNGLVNNLMGSVSNLTKIFNTNALTAQSSDETVLSAAISGNGASPGNYALVVSQLAAANQIASSPFATKDSALNIGDSFVIATGSNTFTVSLASTDTLENIRDHINISLDNQGVSASILSTTASDGVTPEYRLLLTSKQTGTAQAINLSGGALTDLGLNNVMTAAADAQFTFNGLQVVRGVNTVSDLLDGITLTLNAANSNATLTISPNASNQAANVQQGLASVIDAYNAAIDLINKNQSSRHTRDYSYAQIKSQLQNIMQQSLGSGAIQTWLDMGIQSAPSSNIINSEGTSYVSTGKLEINSSVLETAISQNYLSIVSYFTSQNGFINALQTTVDGMTDDDTGMLLSQEKAVKQQERIIDQRMEREQSRLELVKEHLLKQYSALDVYVQHYQQISHFLEQQIESMNYIHSSH